MDFLVPSGGNTNLPKELVTTVIEDAIEKSIFLKLANLRGNLLEVQNEKTLPILGEADSSKVYSGASVSDVTVEDEMGFDIKPINLDPSELVTHIWLTNKQAKIYTALKLEETFKSKLTSAVSKTSDEIALSGDIAATPAKNRLNNSDGLVKLANLTNAAAAPIGYTTANASNILDVVARAQDDIGVWGQAEYLSDLIIFASPSFVTASKTSADKNMIGYEIEDYKPLNLRIVPYIHGIPVIKRSLISGEKAIMVNMAGAYMGHSEGMEVSKEYNAGKRATVYVMSYFTDFKWAFKNGSGKNTGLITMEKSS